MISKKAVAFGAVILILVTAFFSSFVTLKVNEYIVISQGDAITGEDFTEMKEFYKKFSQIRQIIERDYIEAPETEKLLTGAIKGMVTALGDPYSYYLTPEEYKEFMISVQGSYAGVGLSVTITENDNRITVLKAFKGSPALEAGILSGDKIIQIDDQDVDGALLDIAVGMMRGEPDTPVKVVVLRDGEILEFSLVRAVINFPDMEYRMLENKIGYIWLYRFDESSSKNFKDAVADLQSQGMEGLVLDLRTNPGGLLSECMQIADVLLPEGLVLYSEDRQGNREEYASGKDYLGIPLAVIVNEYSASASEVLAGAIQDHEVGTVIGKTTFGKGLVQTLRGPFKEGDVLKLTTSKYFTPKGRDLHKKGVVPDIEVEVTEEALTYLRENRGEELPLELDAPLMRSMEEVMKEINP